MVYAEWTALRHVGDDEDGQPIFGLPQCGTLDCDHALGRPECICDDPALVKLANPSLERSAAPAITWEYIQSERRAMAEIITTFLRERMGVGDTPAGAGRAIAPQLWEARASTMPEPKVLAIGIAVDRDRVWASIGAVGRGYLGAVRRDRLGPWVLEEAKRIAKEYGVPVAVDTKGGAASFIKPLKDSGVTVFEASTEDYILACADVYDGLVGGDLQHGNHDDLNGAAANAGWRYIGNRRVWSSTGGDISMLEADTVALRAAALAPSRVPLGTYA